MHLVKQCERYEVVCVVMCTGDVPQPDVVPVFTQEETEEMMAPLHMDGMSFCATSVYVCYCACALKNVELYAIVEHVETPSSQCDSNALSVYSGIWS
jgi:hypothetical protein